jgi:nitrite reductase/ring-hydroxylating ferredoxin subunit
MNWTPLFASRQEMEAALPAGQPVARVLAGKSICLVRTEGGLWALRDRCPHNGERLSKGRLNAYGEIICPWHGYRFNLQTGRECQERSADVETFPTRETPDGIFLAL